MLFLIQNHTPFATYSLREARSTGGDAHNRHHIRGFVFNAKAQGRRGIQNALRLLRLLPLKILCATPSAPQMRYRAAARVRA
jgi:hypothetical protein